MFLNLLPEFPYKSFMFTAVLRITQYETTSINDLTLVLNLVRLCAKVPSSVPFTFEYGTVYVHFITSTV